MTVRRLYSRASAGLVVVSLLALAACSDSSSLLRPEPATLKTSPTPAPAPPPAQYIVLFKDGSNELADTPTSGVELGKMRYVNGAVYGYVTDPHALRADANVEAVVENIQMQTSDAYPVGAQFFAQGWQWDMLQIHADQVPVAYQGQGARACIIDTGIDGTHQDLAGKVVANGSFVTPAYGYPGPGPSPAPLDSNNGHGTHVSGTVTTNGIGSASVHPAAKLMAAKVFAATGSGSRAAIRVSHSWVQRTMPTSSTRSRRSGDKPFSAGTQRGSRRVCRAHRRGAQRGRGGRGRGWQPRADPRSGCVVRDLARADSGAIGGRHGSDRQPNVQLPLPASGAGSRVRHEAIVLELRSGRRHLGAGWHELHQSHSGEHHVHGAAIGLTADALAASMMGHRWHQHGVTTRRRGRCAHLALGPAARPRAHSGQAIRSSAVRANCYGFKYCHVFGKCKHREYCR